ncbi:hypothetical protein GlitD10_1051 [Gloeomargarita lithophora Alchichica-D10]|uniref:Uncharacterized protein n=1 Tax=Gloeomargarita lithophora Alchichica-D10 TaxID=1188229 RepID=A0A1J0ABR7_9CYAN|nr:hypothetical protein [Gloeomargarita lithophora]APB33371.1 hypothetical protein GlitD10_1051 [Gloeomargarita lithophora Alchichica-D10]
MNKTGSGNMELVQAGGKGKVAIYRRDGLYWLRWSYGGKRYSLSVGHSQTKPARALAAKIETDMAAGHFDATLETDRPKVDQKVDQGFDGLRGGAIPVLGTLELWEQFTESRRQEGTSGTTIAAKYQPMTANLSRWEQDIDSK